MTTQSANKQTQEGANSPYKFHGYSVSPKTTVIEDCPRGHTAIQLHIGRLPKRKGLCLYIAETNKFIAQITPLAHFKNEEAAKTAQRVLDWMILKQEPI